MSDAPGMGKSAEPGGEAVGDSARGAKPAGDEAVGPSRGAERGRDRRKRLGREERDKPVAERESRSRMGDAVFAVQRFVIERAWSLLLLLVASEVGSFAIHKTWDSVSRSTGRVVTQTVLLALGLVLFWIWPRRARFMRRLCFLLVFAGGVLVAVSWVVEVFAGTVAVKGHLDAIRDAWVGELGLLWLISGAFLAALMYGGRYVFGKWREKPEFAARRASGKRS